MFKQRRHYNKTPSRRKVPGVGAENERGRRTPIGIVSASHALGVLTVTFDQPVILKGLPGWTDNGGHVITAAVMTSATVGSFTFDGTVATPLTIPFEDPGIRNSAGGYVRPASQVVT